MQEDGAAKTGDRDTSQRVCGAWTLRPAVQLPHRTGAAGAVMLLCEESLGGRCSGRAGERVGVS